MEKEIVSDLKQKFDLPEHVTADSLENLLSEKINYLIQNNFELLIRILYRIDVSEKKLKQMLRENKEAEAGKIIARLIIDRQLEKQRSRQQSSRDQNNIIDENESW